MMLEIRSVVGGAEWVIGGGEGRGARENSVAVGLLSWGDGDVYTLSSNCIHFSSMHLIVCKLYNQVNFKQYFLNRSFFNFYFY